MNLLWNLVFINAIQTLNRNKKPQNMNLRKSFLALSLLFSSTFIFAQSVEKPWSIDKSHSAVSFTVTHLMISEVTGNFKDWDIQVSSSKEDFSDMKVSAKIKVASINTDNSKRDEHLMGDDFFNAEKYPEISFVSTGVKKAGGKNYKITGNMTIRDVTKPVIFDAVYNGSIKSPWGNTVHVWKATTKINRMDYKLNWNKAMETGGVVVSDEVSINLVMEMSK